MKLVNYNEETGWADVEYKGRSYTIRLTDYSNLDAVKKHLAAEDKKANKKPALKFDINEGGEL
jgi:hypothetical protein